jgi:hypothetical protein
MCFKDMLIVTAFRLAEKQYRQHRDPNYLPPENPRDRNQVLQTNPTTSMAEMLQQPLKDLCYSAAADVI